MLKILSNLGEKVAKLMGEPATGDSLEHAFSGEPLAHLLPWQAYDEEYRVFVNNSSLGFTIEAIPLVGSTHVAAKEIASIFEEILEEGESLQCLLWADHRTEPFLEQWEKAHAPADEIYKEIAHKRSLFFQNSPSLNPRIFRFILSFSKQAKCEPMILEKLKEKGEKILKTLKGFTYAYTWRVEDFLHTVGALVNFTRDKDVKKRHWNPFQNLSSQLSTGGSLSIEESHLKWETDTTTCLKTFRVIDYPSHWSLAEMQKLIGDVFRDSFRIQTPFYIQYGVHCPKQAKEEGKFKRRSHLIEKQGRSSLLMRFIPALAEELRESDAVRKELGQSSKFVWTQLSAGVWADKENLTYGEQSLKSLFRINQFTLSENRYLHLPSYLSTLPMSWAEYVPALKELNLLRTTLNTECNALVPIQGEWMGTKTAGMLLIGRRGQLVNWNPFDSVSNYNTIVVGRSGSGKSVFMQDFILNNLGTGAKVFVFEVGRSFERLCHILGGQHIEFSRESNICLNPFTKISSQDEEAIEDSISFLKSLISFMAAPTQGTSDYENALIETAIRQVWTTKKNNARITDVAEWLCNYKDRVAKVLGVMLTPYTKEGIYAKYFEGDNNVDFTSSMVLIELEELKGKRDLQTVVLQLFIMTISNQIFLGDRKTPSVICIDEGWDLLRDKQTGPFIETLARRLRKYYGSLIVGTQNPEDFFATPAALAAWKNSDWRCFLALQKDSIASFLKSGNLEMDDAQKYALESVSKNDEYSEVMICDADGNYSIARLMLDPFSKLLYTTTAQDYVKIKDLQMRGMNLSQAINYLIKNEKR